MFDALAEPPGLGRAPQARPTPWRTAPLLTHGFVTLVDVMPRLIARGRIGIEAAIVDAARTSYAGGTRAVTRDRSLLRYLLRHRHTTPFEKVVFTFRIRAPLFVARQWMRHRAGSFNEESARYSVVANEGYAPAPAEVRGQATGAGASRQCGGESLPAPEAETARAQIKAAWAAAYETYSALLAGGVAREIARAVLPVGMFTTFVWKVDLWNLFHFLNLRMDAGAQEQIRVYAGAIHQMLRIVAPEATSAFDDYIGGAVSLSRHEVDAIRAACGEGEGAGAGAGAEKLLARLRGARLPSGRRISRRERAEWARTRARLFGPETDAKDS